MSLPPVFGRGVSLPARAASRPDFWDHVDMLGDCWEWTGADTEWGYGKLTLNGHTFSAHRCAYEFLVDAIPDGMFVCHRCDNPPCVRPDHLFLGSAKDNTRDMHNKGRYGTPRVPGEHNHLARLTEKQVIEIREQFAAGVAPKDLAARFKVTSSGINRIIRGKTWADTDGPISTIDRRGLHRRKAS